MIWSSKASDLRRNYETLRRNRPPVLRTTEKMRSVFEERAIPFEPVEYLEVPAVAHTIGKLVVPYVALDGRGMLITSLPSFYAVTKRSDTRGFESKNITGRLQESHVTAEDLSLRRGIFTPYGRS